MNDVSACDVIAEDIWRLGIAPAFTDALTGMSRLWRAADKDSDELKAVQIMVDVWGETYEFCPSKIGEEFPGVGEHWDALKQVRERLALDDG